MLPTPEQLSGPLGALILAVGLLALFGKAIHVLWKEHLESDDELVEAIRHERDVAKTLAETAVEGTRRMAEAWETRNQRDRDRHRHDDEATPR